MKPRILGRNRSIGTVSAQTAQGAGSPRVLTGLLGVKQAQDAQRAQGAELIKATPRERLIARATMFHKDGGQTIVEIHNDCSHHFFYRWFKREAGAKLRTHLRVSDRGDAPDLQALVDRTTKLFVDLNRGKPGFGLYGGVQANMYTGRMVLRSKIVVFKKRQYKRYLTCSVDKLPGYRPSAPRETFVAPAHQSRPAHVGLGGYTSLQRKMDILTGRG